MPWGPLLVSAVCASAVFAVAFREWWVGWVRRTWARRRRAPERKPVDMVAVAEVEHALWPDTPGVWVHSCRDMWRRVAACADTPAGQEERRVAASTAPSGVFTNPGALTQAEADAIRREWATRFAQPAVVLNAAEPVRILNLGDCPLCETWEEATRPVARYRSPCEQHLDLDPTPEPDEPGPE